MRKSSVLRIGCDNPSLGVRSETISKAGSQLIGRRFTRTSQLTHRVVYASLVDFLQRSGGGIQSLPFDAAACPRDTMENLLEDAVDEFLARTQKSRGYAMGPGTPMNSALSHLNLLDVDRPSRAAVLPFASRPRSSSQPPT